MDFFDPPQGEEKTQKKTCSKSACTVRFEEMKCYNTPAVLDHMFEPHFCAKPGSLDITLSIP